jgi:hypothetical protein
MTAYADPLERRDAWRSLWQVLAGDALLLLLCILVGMGLLAALLLPQSPAAGTADPITFSQWEAMARLREGAFFNFLNSLGMNNVFRAGWWRLALVLLTVASSVRMFDRIQRLLAARRNSVSLRDELRVRVAQDAPALEAMAAQLRQRGYRVALPEADVLAASRAPLAEGFSIALHAGILMACIGLLLNAALGWEAPNRNLQASTATALPDGTSLLLDEGATPAGMQLVLQRGDATLGSAPLQSGAIAGIQVALKQITPGYRISAATQNGQPLRIRASNFVSPTTEVLLNLTEASPEQYVALPDARLALAVSAGASAGQPERVRIFALPSGQVVTDTAVQPQLTLGEVTFTFKPARGAVIDATHSPGNIALWLGLPLALLGLLGALMRPMQRIIVQHHGHWTEFYADGRGVRSVINRLLESLAPQNADVHR